MTKECNEKEECVSSLNIDGISTESLDIDINKGNSIFSIKPVFDNPFILGYSKLNLRLQLDKIESKTEFLIKRVKVYDMITYTNKVPLAEIDVNQILYTTNTRIDLPIILEMDRNNSNSEEVMENEATLAIEVFYDKNQIDYSGNLKTTSQSFEKEIKKDLRVIIMPKNTCDQEDCVDNNSCTRDYCRSVNDYNYCVNEYLIDRGCCGNKVCDPGEDKCACPTDCGDCDYDYGDFIHYGCNQNDKCVPQIKEGTLEKKFKIFSTDTITDFTYDVKVTYEQPHNLDVPFKVEMTLQDVKSNVKNPQIQSIQIVESVDNLLGDLNIGDDFGDIGDTETYNIEPEYLSMSDSERELNPKLIINFRYNVEGREDPYLKKASFSLDKIAFVDT